MFTIIPKGRTSVLEQIGENGDEVVALLASVVPDSQLPLSPDRPSVQLAHSEIADDEVERALGYGGITKADSPIGLPTAMAPVALGGDHLIFSLRDLEAHLRQTAPDLSAEYDRAGGFRPFVESRELSAFEHLVAGLLECIQWCLSHRAALSIRW
jgi:hypothetical protein